MNGLTDEQSHALQKYLAMDCDLQAVMDTGITPAVPPEDYKGSVAKWMIELQTRGLWDGEGWHGDVWIPADDWWDILETCEGGPPAGECSIHCEDDKHHETCRVTEAAE